MIPLSVRFPPRHGVQQGIVGNRSAFATLKVIQFPLRQDVERFSVAPPKESPKRVFWYAAATAPSFVQSDAYPERMNSAKTPAYVTLPNQMLFKRKSMKPSS